MVYTQEGVIKDSRPWTKMFIAGATAIALAVGMFAQTFAASKVYVTESNPQGWVTGETRANGDVNFVADADAPYGVGALQLITGDATGSPLQDKAQYLKSTNTPLVELNDVSYWTKQVSASFEAGLPSFQLPTCLYGLNEANTGCANVPGTSTSSFTTLVYEPYVDKGNAAVELNTWQKWDVDAGKLWSSKTVGGLTSTQGSITYNISDLKITYPNAVVFQFGVNVGSNNPNYDTRVDGVVFNDTTYDFELVAPDTSAPDVEITSPTAGVEEQGDVTLAATITDNEELLRYYFFVKNVSTGQNVVGPTTVNTSEDLVNFTKTVSTTGWADGEYIFQVEARDAAMNKDGGSTDNVRFMVNNVVDTKDECKNGGWMSFLTENKSSFKNQGQCVSYVQANANASFKRGER